MLPLIIIITKINNFDDHGAGGDRVSVLAHESEGGLGRRMTSRRAGRNLDLVTEMGVNS